MNRKSKMLLNSFVGLLKQLIVVGCGFILPRYILIYYGSSVNGLITSITHFLGFISLLEMGIGPVIQSNLYEPLAQKNNIQISKLVKSTEHFFRTLAFIFLIYIVVLSFVYPKYINLEFDVYFTVSLLLIIAFSTFMEYFFGMTYQVLLNADQKAYIHLGIQIITVLLNTFFSVILIKTGFSIQVVKLVTALIYLVRPFGLIYYSNKHYKLDKTIILTEEPIKQKWNGFSQHFSMVVSNSTGIVLLTLFSSLANVSIYSIYFNITNGVTNIIMSGATGLESMFGNMMANHEDSNLIKTFEKVEFICHFFVSDIFATTTILIVPFVSVYTKGINDINYLIPIFGILIVNSYALQCIRIPYFRIIKAAGHFKETQNGAFISAGLNILISTIGVLKFGILGATFGLLVAMFYHTFYFVWYLKEHILKRHIKFFFSYLITDFIIVIATYFVSQSVVLPVANYFSWFILAIKVFFISSVISVFVNFIFHKALLYELFYNTINKFRI